MIREITIGQYYSGHSTLHQLDPRVKLVGTFVFLISLFLFGNLISYCVATVFLFSMVHLSKVPLRYIVRGLKAVVLLLLITIVIDLFITPGNVLVRIGSLQITDAGVKLAVHIIVRLMYLIIGASLLTLTTTPTRLTDALEMILGPLKKIKVPVHEIAMMMSIALRFIPVLIEEIDRIMKAQSARGVDFEHGNLFMRVKNIVPLLVPLFVASIRRANDLAMAMDARCYRGGEGRTKMKELKYGKSDKVAYVILLIYFVVMWAGHILME